MVRIDAEGADITYFTSSASFQLHKPRLIFYFKMCSCLVRLRWLYLMEFNYCTQLPLEHNNLVRLWHKKTWLGLGKDEVFGLQYLFWSTGLVKHGWSTLANPHEYPIFHLPPPVSSLRHNSPVFLPIYDSFSVSPLQVIITCFWYCWPLPSQWVKEAD